MSRRPDPRAACRLAAVLGFALMGLLLLGVVALAAEPSPSPAEVLVASGDPRSDGAGPGLVGSPLLILSAVVVLGVATAAVTLVLARLTTRD